MKASEVIKRLQRRVDTFGDWDCIIRIADGDDFVEDTTADVTCIRADDDSEVIVISDMLDEIPEGDED